MAKEKASAIGRSREDKIFDFFNNLLMIVILFIVLYPLYFVIIASISEPTAVQSGAVTVFPVGFTVEGFQKLFEYKTIWAGYANTIMYVLISTTISVTFTMLTAYPLSRKRFLGKKFVLFFFMFTMYFSGGMIPLYIQIKRLNLINTMWSVILVGAISVYNVIIARSFLQSTIPEELYEASAMDGCNHFRYFFSIVMPLSKSIIAVLALYYGVAMWNDYFKAMLYLNKVELHPLQLVLRNILTQNEVTSDMLSGADFENQAEQQRLVDLMRYGLIIVSTIPIMAVYPFLQRFFVKGVMIGSVKG